MLGRAPSELKELPMDDYLFFRRVFEKRRFGMFRDDYRIALLTQIVAALAGSNHPISKFMLDLETPKPKPEASDWKALQSANKMMAKVFNGQYR